MKFFQNINLVVQNETWRHVAADYVTTEFLKNFQGNSVYGGELSFDIRAKIDDLYDFTNTWLEKLAPYQSLFYQTRKFVAWNNSLVISISNPDRNQEVNHKTAIVNYQVQVTGDRDLAQKFLQDFETRFRDKSFAKISWYYKDSGYLDSANLYIENTEGKIRNEFYPWFHAGVDTFIQDYLQNGASILLMYGPPGTGKTSFLKHLLCENSLDAIVSYDEDILKDDRFFIDFLTDSTKEILILEDADNLLLSREDDRNAIMSKFLNVSDGLIKLRNKKMIFTTNISQLNKVDSALLRKGRCYAAVEFRKLTSSEAQQAAQAGELPQQNWQSKNEWSLAELFNQDKDSVVKSQTLTKMGFAR